MGKTKLTTERKFWKKVGRQGLNDCWPWMGRKAANGTGILTVNNPDGSTRAVGAHIYVYDLMIDDVPGASHINQTCGDKGCVNPAHLELLLWGKKQESNNENK